MGVCAIVRWLKGCDLSPVTGQPLAAVDLLPNYTLRCMIQCAHVHS